ncbi:MAG: ABC transporter ATP-binding protein [Fervidicoccaceae archaeon]
MELIAELRDIYYSYPDGTRALNGVSLEIRNGSRLCLTGPNGAGKSTLLFVLASLIFPQAGELRIFGEKVERNNAGSIRKKIALLFQNPDDMLFNRSVLEEVAFGLIARGMEREEALSRAETELKRLGIDNLKDRIPHRLSFGQRRLVSLASVLVLEPTLLLLDEPTSNLDEKNKAKMIERINGFLREKREGNWAVVIATQDKEITEICNERAYMEDGKILYIEGH